jgi:hypothetical protein
MAKMEYRVLTPAPPLSAFVEQLWYYAGKAFSGLNPTAWIVRGTAFQNHVRDGA